MRAIGEYDVRLVCEIDHQKGSIGRICKANGMKPYLTKRRPKDNLFFAVATILALAQAVAKAESCKNPDGDRLLLLDQQGQNTDVLLSLGWQCEADVCTWSNVTCNDQDQIVKLTLSKLQLKGTLPKEWAEGFEFLETLDLGGNMLTGTLPEEWPEGFPNLKTLNLKKNQLSGLVPTSWFEDFPALEYLNIFQNNFPAAPLPEVASSRLHELHLGELKFTGPPPPNYAFVFPHLEVLHLHSNELIGQLPDEWADGFANLTHLEVGRNMKLGGTLPTSWGKAGAFPKLQILKLEESGIRGNLPYEEWRNGFPAINEMDLSGNFLTGTVPGGWNGMGPYNNVTVNLEDNYLQGGFKQKSGDPPPEGVTDEDTSSSDSSSNTGLIVGLSVGIPVGLAVIAAVIAGLWYVRARKAEELDKDSDTLAAFMKTLPGNNSYSGPPLSSIIEDIIIPPRSSQSADGAQVKDKTPPLSSTYTDIVAPGAYMRTTYTDTPPVDSIYDSVSIRMESGALSLDTTPSSKAELDIRTWIIDPQDVRLCRDERKHFIRLGKGATSEVYKARYLGDTVALKVMEIAGQMNDPTCSRRILREINMLRQCSHVNILRFHGTVFTDAHIMLVFDYMPKGDLFNALHRGNPSAESNPYAWANKGRAIALGVAEALKYLHAKRILHCDIKAQNILLDDDDSPKLADLGMSKFMHKDFVTKGGDVGTFAYAAPELLTDSRVTSKVDVYSLGVILWELVTGELPHKEARRRPRVPEECSQDVFNIIAACLSLQPNNRPTADQLCDMLASVQ